MSESTIKDGTGKGYLTKVNDDNQLLASVVSRSEEEFISAEKSNAYCGTTALTPLTNPNGVILYLKNTSGTHTLIVERLLLSFSASGAMMSCQKNDTGTPGTSTAVTQVNVNFGAANNASSTLLKPSGTGITGLTDGDYIAVFHDLIAGRQNFPIDGTFVLDESNVFTVVVTDGAASPGAHTGDVSWVIRYRFVEKT